MSTKDNSDPNAVLTHVAMVQGIISIATASLLVDKGIISRDELIGKVRHFGIKTFGDTENPIAKDALTLIERNF